MIEEFNLHELAASIIEAQKIDTYKADVLYDKHAKDQAKYRMGEELLKAREMFPENVEFGKWIKTYINEPLIECGEKPLAKNTPANYMALPKFGSIEDCLLVGYSNVYKLVQNNNLPVIELLHAVLNGDEVEIDGELIQPITEQDQKELIKKILGKKNADKKLYTEAQQDFAVQSAKAAVYSELFGIDVFESNEQITENDIKPLMFDPEKIKHIGIEFINEFRSKYM